MFLSQPDGFTSRRRILRYGYESTARLLVAERARWEAAFAPPRRARRRRAACRRRGS